MGDREMTGTQDRPPTSGCAAGGWCSAAGRPTAPGRAGRAATRRWTARSPRSTAAAGGERAAAAAERSAGSAAPRRRWPAGSATSAVLPLAPSSRSCSATRSSGSACPRCCWSRRCWRRSRPDVHLVGTLLSLNKAMPETTKETARAVVRKVVEELEKRLAQPDPGRRSPARSTGPRGSTARGTPTSTGTAPSAPTSSTTSPSTARSCRSGWSATAARPQAVQRTSCCASTSPARWPRRSSTPAVFGAVLASMRGAAHLAGGLRHRGGGPHRRSWTTRSRCCSAPSSAAAPTSTGRSPTARR